MPVVIRRKTALASLGALATLVAFPSTCAYASLPTWQYAVDSAAKAAPQARIVVVDVATGRLLAGHRLDEASRTLAAPGSTLKPLILYQMLASGRWSADHRIACNRRLAIAGHRLACSHPSAPPFDARAALAWSCNTYFAEAARAIPRGDFGALLRSSAVLGATGLMPNEAIAEFHEPRSLEAAQLAVLGVDGIRVTPLELAEAYRWLAREIAAHPDSIAAQTVLSGLDDSASFGMAGPASLGGVAIAGKTGTAKDTSNNQTHGWFIGFAPSTQSQVIVAIYLPAVRGVDAARLAAELLAASPLRKP